MKKILFYCQYLSGMGHLIRSTEIVRSLVKNFQVYFINGGPAIEGFELPPEVKSIQLPALWLEDGEFRIADSCKTVEYIQEIRKNQLVNIFEKVQPDCLITEFFPFGRHMLLFELLPLLNYIKSAAPDTKVICSLRDVIGKLSNEQEEETICYLMNKYFDLLLFHSDVNFQTFADSFIRHQDIKCHVAHTGFISQPLKENFSNLQDLWGKNDLNTAKILVSVGGGRIGYELLEAVVKTSTILAKKIKHKIQIFTGPFMPEEKLLKLQQSASTQANIKITKYTPHLIEHMQTADVSISLSGYNTAMNIISTGVRAIVVPLSHNERDQEQLQRTQKLEKLGIVKVIHPNNLEPTNLAKKIINCLENKPVQVNKLFDLKGADNTTAFLQTLLEKKSVVSSNYY